MEDFLVDFFTPRFVKGAIIVLSCFVLVVLGGWASGDPGD